ncbi:nuclear transport factor 2 family protein [Microbacterium sp. SD291]|uniref:YybH family protein n=1 Tax=Microbacterium sp. SD291 TaxID=2782007 RepID=UPI001A95DF3D|nr:nuclear transport factor 2 family protein [Microbacterium sp. SD291]MBO0980688.1 nuclear transport factor 2 family protein [Microbacterium sp. SD291]
MTSRGEQWVEDYVQAWRSNDPDQIGALFSEDARYLTSPDAEPRVGREAIVGGWLEDLDEPGSWTFEWEVVKEHEGFVLVQGRTEYPDERDYLNLWVIRLDDTGRAAEFTEWYMPRPHGS